MAKQASKVRWQGFERFIAFIIGGMRVYGQSTKFHAKKAGQGTIAVGDAQSECLLGECKAYDPAAKTQWRKDNPYIPSTSFRVDVEWLTQAKEEAQSIDKLPFLAFSRKFSQLIDTHIVLDLDTFIHLIYKAGYGKFENIEDAMKAWKEKKSVSKKSESKQKVKCSNSNINEGK
jgi:hypothetical protein